jgi:hypothetical protein
MLIFEGLWHFVDGAEKYEENTAVVEGGYSGRKAPLVAPSARITWKNYMTTGRITTSELSGSVLETVQTISTAL